MIHIVQFSAAADTGTIVDETRGFTRMPGIKSLTILEAATAQQGQPRYMVQIETDDAQDELVGKQLQLAMQEHGGELWSVNHRAYRKVG